jgi:hypothetical protein
MLRRLKWLAIAAVAWLAACASKDPGPTTPQVVTPAAPAAVAEEPGGAEPEATAPPEAEPVPTAPAQASYPFAPPAGKPARAMLGAPCPAAGAQKPDPCGSRGRVSLEVDARSVSLGRGAECQLQSLRRDSKSMYEASACIDGDMLYAANTCIACRMLHAGWSAKAIISELTRAQALEVQNQLGLSPTLSLKSPDDWRRALSAAAAQP